MADYVSIKTSTEPPDRLMDTIQARLPGALEQTVRLELANILNDFLENTKAWWVETSFMPKEGITEYILNPISADARVFTIIKLTRNDVGSVKWWSQEPGIITLEETPSEDWTDPVKVTCALSLRKKSVSVPKFIYEHHHECIVNGVIGEMMAHLGRPYSSPQQALIHQKRYRNLRAKARSAARRSWSQNQPPWIYPRQTLGRGYARGRRLSSWS